MWYRLIPAPWTNGLYVKEGSFTNEELKAYNEQGYNVYFFPNHSSYFEPSDACRSINGTHIDLFNFVFVDCDLKDGVYKTKEEFVEKLNSFELEPTFIVDSGNGVHAYWKINDLDANSYMRLQKRLIRYFDTDQSLYTILQLMRVPGFQNVKKEGEFKLAKTLAKSNKTYDCEELNEALPIITPEDEADCKEHYSMVYEADKLAAKVTNDLPKKFLELTQSSQEARDLFYKHHKDRSAADYRLCHLMLANGFNKEEAMQVLCNTGKAVERSAKHRHSYAKNIADKVYIEGDEPAVKKSSAKSMTDINKKIESGEKEHPRLYGHPMIDATHSGFKLTEVMGLVAGTNIGKTQISMNFFKWFVQNNPEYIHVFVALEEDDVDVAERWNKLCSNAPELVDKVFVITNYDDEGKFRELSLDDIRDEIKDLEKEQDTKVGCIVMDHIGALKMDNRREERETITSVCKKMKAFAVETNTFLIMQSQSSRAKAQGGDIEIDKDAAYGTTTFEWYCDYVMTVWRPLKRVEKKAPFSVTAFKYCKIRKYDIKKDKIRMDVPYGMLFQTDTGEFRRMTSEEHMAYEFWNTEATVIRNRDKSRDPAPVEKMDWMENGKVDNN